MIYNFIMNVPIILFFPLAVCSAFCILKHTIFCLEREKYRTYNEKYMSAALFVCVLFAVGLCFCILTALFREYEVKTEILFRYGTLAVMCLAVIPPYSFSEILKENISASEKKRFYFGFLMLLFVMLLWKNAEYFLEHGQFFIPVLLQRIGL